MELIEKLQKIIEREIDNVPMVLTDPLTLRRLRAERLAQAAYAALIEHAGGDGVTEGDREAAASGYFAWCSGNPVIPDRMKAGQADDHSMVQAFARHRATAFAAGKAARDREV